MLFQPPQRQPLSGTHFPRLRDLALCLSSFVDDLAIALVASPLIKQLKVLDLSLGNLTDRGAQALLESPEVLHLNKLVAIECETENDVEVCSDKMMQRLHALPIEVDISNREGYAFEGPDWFQV